MITADQLLAHAIGDYILQSDWMANKKRTEHAAAAVHALVYSLPFLFLLSSTPWSASRDGGHGSLQWLVIVGTHFLIDHYGLARYVVWAKNWLAPFSWIGLPNDDKPDPSVCQQQADGSWVPAKPLPFYVWRSTLPWRYCTATGYPPDRPAWLAVWLLIIADNILHVVINGLALRYL